MGFLRRPTRSESRARGLVARLSRPLTAGMAAHAGRRGEVGVLSGIVSLRGVSPYRRKIIDEYPRMARKKAAPTFCKNYTHPSVQTGS